jgi:integrase
MRITSLRATATTARFFAFFPPPVFSVTRAMLLLPLPYRDGERLVTIFEANPSRGIANFPPTQWLIIVAIESGARLAEILAIRWADVDLEKHCVLIRAVEVGAKKTSRARELPLSSRLLGVLEMAKPDPSGREYKPTTYVLGVLGVRVKSVKKAWETAVLRSHGHEPSWIKGALSPNLD